MVLDRLKVEEVVRVMVADHYGHNKADVFEVFFLKCLVEDLMGESEATLHRPDYLTKHSVVLGALWELPDSERVVDEMFEALGISPEQ